MHCVCIHEIFFFFKKNTGINKKLNKLAKKKPLNSIGDWSHSIVNHMYWCAASSQGNGQLIKEKWLSILNHVTNVHVFHGEERLFQKCEHGPLEDRDWIKKGDFEIKYEKENVSYERISISSFIFKKHEGSLLILINSSF